MKKILLATVVSAAAATGVFAQGSVDNVTGLFNFTSLTDPGGTAYSGNVTIALYYAATASVQASQVTAINSAANAGIALGDLASDNFAEASVPTVTGTTVGAGTFNFSGGAPSSPAGDEMGLVGVPTGGSGWLAVVITEVGGANPGYAAVIAFNQANLGADPNAPTPGQPGDLPADYTGSNVALSSTSAVPEPATMALAALGGASLLMFRRKK
jgi:hypothetical protein